MATSRKGKPETGPPHNTIVSARTPGILGLLDHADPNTVAYLGDTPGPLGINDHGQPLILQPTLFCTWLQPTSLGVSTVQWITQPISHITTPTPVPGNLLPSPNPSAPVLSEADFKKAADQLGVEAAVVHAVADVESGGKGFDSQGRPRILFEAHWFHKFTGGKYHARYPHLSQSTWDLAKKYYTKDEWKRLNEAMTLDTEAAWKSASWGKFQIMGFNHNGWGNVKDFVFAMFESEFKHLRSFLAYCKDRGLVTHLKNKNWAEFARGYNGADYAKNNYDVRMKTAYEKYAK